jgi:hypothetical protein
MDIRNPRPLVEPKCALESPSRLRLVQALGGGVHVCAPTPEPAGSINGEVTVEADDPEEFRFHSDLPATETGANRLFRGRCFRQV